MPLFKDLFFSPLFVLVDPSQRVFFGYLLASGIFGVLALRASGTSLFKVVELFTNRKIWSHPSVSLDFKLFLFNGALKTLLFSGATLSSVGIAGGVLAFLRGVWPNWTPVSLSYEVLILLFTGLSFVVMDFSRFFQHYVFHKVPWLWNFHKVHHSATVLTPITLFRTHPVESLVSFVRRSVVMGSLSGLCIFCTGSILTSVDVIGVNVLDFVFNILGSNLRHSHIWISFGFLNRFIMSPAQHQIHHSRAQRHHDKNFGVALSVWDQLFGTFFNVSSKKPFLVFGVRGLRHHALSDLLPKKLGALVPSLVTGSQKKSVEVAVNRIS